MLFSFFFFLIDIFWSIIASQYCVSICCTTKWISHMHTYIPISPPSWASLPPSLSHLSRSSQSTELISLCSAVASHYFPNMGKEIVTQVQEAKRVLYRINPRRNTPKHILIKLTKIKFKEKNIKSGKGKKPNNTQGNPHKVNIWSLSRNSASQKGVAGYT